MAKLSDLEYLKLSKWKKFGYKLGNFFMGIPKGIGNFIMKLLSGIGKGAAAIGREVQDIVTTFIHGDWKTKVSYLVMGFGNIARGQILRGLLFLLFEIVFIGYMILSGGYWLSMMPSLGKVGPTEEYNEIYDTFVTKYNDNSFQILLYSVLTIFFIIAFIYTQIRSFRYFMFGTEILKTGDLYIIPDSELEQYKDWIIQDAEGMIMFDPEAGISVAGEVFRYLQEGKEPEVFRLYTGAGSPHLQDGLARKAAEILLTDEAEKEKKP